LSLGAFLGLQPCRQLRHRPQLGRVGLDEVGVAALRRGRGVAGPEDRGAEDAAQQTTIELKKKSN
jgi:hypothetical protein